MNLKKIFVILIFSSAAVVLSLQNISLAVLSSEISVTIAARLESLEAVDGNNGTRRSSTTLQMVSKDIRTAIVTAYKDYLILDWPPNQPIWTGLASNSGVDSVTVTTGITGSETTRVGDVSKTVTIEIVDPDKQEFTFAGMDTINKISLFAEKLASTFSLSAGGGDEHLSVSASREWVDKYADPLVAYKVNVTLTGSTPRFTASVGVPSYSIDLPLIKMGLFLNADVGASAKMSYTYDPSLSSPSSPPVGSVTADGSIGATAYLLDLKGNLDWQITAGGTFTIPAEVSANFISTAPQNPGLSSTASVGPATVEIEASVETPLLEWRLNAGTWDVIGKQTLW